jgi:Ni/Co efflux regulator RcnB
MATPELAATARGTARTGRTFHPRHKEQATMKYLLISAAAIVVLMGTGAAFSQTDQTTTTVTHTPDSTTQTTVTKSQDADGNYTQYRKTVTSTRHYDAGAWAPPADYRPHHIGVGDRLTPDLLASNYYVSNYGSYDLASPPEGTVWVRVGADVFLVRSDNGEVIQADYGMFN